jgi:hypothetical protein
MSELYGDRMALFIFGMFLLLLAVVYTYTGKAWIRFHGWVNRAEDPKRYWLEVSAYYLGGIGFIGYTLLKVCGLWN